MQRHDLLALSADDLISLSTRGAYKSAVNKLKNGTLTGRIEIAEDSTVIVHWSDGRVCHLPPTTKLSECECMDADTGQFIARNPGKTSGDIVRSVLLYQHWARQQVNETSEMPAIAPWNPGDISDEKLAQYYSSATLTRLRKEYERGHVIEVVISRKPSAHLHSIGCNLRFLVPGEIQYAHCDCAEEAPCSHVPLAIMAFRDLAAGQSGAVIESATEKLPVPHELLDALDDTMLDLLETGMSGASKSLMSRWQQLSKRCMDENLVWLAAILDEIQRNTEQYAAQDAQFSPQHQTKLIGELLIRSAAIRQQSDAIPEIFVRGSQRDKTTRILKSRMPGLGCDVQVQRKGVTLTVYMQDDDSGQVMTVRRHFPDPDDDSGKEPVPYHQLAKQKALRGVPFEQLGAGQLFARGGRRQPDYSYHPPRDVGKFSISPQRYDWQKLRPPVLVEDFMTLRTRLQNRHPATLRPRRPGEDFFVCAVMGAVEAGFNPINQTVQAALIDSDEQAALLRYPYTTRGADGVEALLWYLQHHAADLRFVSGHVRNTPQGLLVQPVALVFDTPDGKRMIQPGVTRWNGDPVIGTHSRAPQIPTDPVQYYPGLVMDALSELLLTGLLRVDDSLIRRWEQLLAQGEALGFLRFVCPIETLTQALQAKRHASHWDWRIAGAAALETLRIVRFSQEQIL